MSGIYLVDANVLSEIWKPQPARAVLDWFSRSDWFLPVPVIAEIQAGAESARSPARKAAINGRLDAFLNQYPLAVVDWDAETSRTWGRLAFSPAVRREPQSLWDSLIDAMGVRWSATVATRNAVDFRHAKTFDPWTVSKDPPVEPSS